MKKISVIVILLVVVMLLGACGGGNNKSNKGGGKQFKSTKEQKENKARTEIYLVKVNSLAGTANDSRQNQLEKPTATDISRPVDNQDFRLLDFCSGEIISLKIDGKLSPKETLEKLFDYKADAGKGFYNAFSTVKNIKIEKLIIKNNFAIITLSGDFQKGNGCLGRLMHDQIVKTLSQFDDIAGADVFVGEEEITGYVEKLNGE